MERNILLTIEYDGTGFSGWQRQPERRTVQGTLEEALSRVCTVPVQVDGTSRTDAGVHALGQRASFHGDFGIPVERIPLAVNNLVSEAGKDGDMRIRKAQLVPEGFHARYDSKGKKYRYRIHNGEEMPVFLRNYRYHVRGALDAAAMCRAAEHITGTHDFACFQAAGGTPRKTTVRTIRQLTVNESAVDGGRLIDIDVAGDGFLYNMVRIIAGTLVEAGQGKIPPEAVPGIIASRDRRRAGHTAPPQGLYLTEVYY